MDAKYQFHFNRSISPSDAADKALELYEALSKLPEVQEPVPPLTSILEELKGAAEVLREVTKETTAGNKTLIPERDSALAQVIDKLNRVGAHMQLLAWDKAYLLHKSGFDQVRPRTAPGPLIAPENFTVKNDDDPGVVVCGASPMRGAHNYEITYTDGDPTLEEWPGREIYHRSTRIVISGLEQGKKYSFRMRAIGPNNKRGPWSPYVTMIVT